MRVASLPSLTSGVRHVLGRPFCAYRQRTWVVPATLNMFPVFISAHHRSFHTNHFRIDGSYVPCKPVAVSRSAGAPRFYSTVHRNQHRQFASKAGGGPGGMGENHTHYQLLGVSAASSPREIKDAYRKKARSCHPDLHGGETTAEFQRDRKSVV